MPVEVDAQDAAVASGSHAARPGQASRPAHSKPKAAAGRRHLSVPQPPRLAAVLGPFLWLDWFTSDAGTLAFGAQYLRITTLLYGLFGLGMAFYFASRRTGSMALPVAASRSACIGCACRATPASFPSP